MTHTTWKSWEGDCKEHHWHVIHVEHSFNGKNTHYRCCHCGSTKSIFTSSEHDNQFWSDNTKECGPHGLSETEFRPLSDKVKEIHDKQRKKYYE